MALDLLEQTKTIPQTTLGGNCVTAFIYYRFYLDCVLALDNDIIDVTENYTIFQLSKQLPASMHLYVKTMIKIYDLLDRGIIYLYKIWTQYQKTILLLSLKRHLIYWTHIPTITPIGINYYDLSQKSCRRKFYSMDYT